MTHFKLKGDKHSAFPVKWEGKKIHLYGARDYDSEKLGIPFEEIKSQLGANIIWHEDIMKE